MQETSSIISTIDLNRFITITLLDETRHYFGGYYHVKVLVYCDVPLVESFFDSKADFMDARSRLGETVRFERILEKMAVPEHEQLHVRGKLVDAFNDTALEYLSAPGFAGSFVRSSYRKSINKPARHCFPGL